MTIDRNYIDLINADIDGEISAGDKADLEAFLSESAEARALHDALSGLCTSLDAVAAEDPPRHLRHVIMNSVDLPATEPEAPGFVQNLLAAPAFRYAATFAAGVFLTLSLINSGQISNQAFDDVTGLVGSVADPIDAQLVSSVLVEETDIAGTVSLRSAGSMLILDFDLVSTDPIEIEAGYTDPSIWFNGFAQLESSGTSISAETGRVTLGMKGKRRYAVYLHNEGGRETTVNLLFKADGAIVHRATLDYEPAR